MSKQTRPLRPLTVNEALQYSPFSSIVPFNPGEHCGDLLGVGLQQMQIQFSCQIRALT